MSPRWELRPAGENGLYLVFGDAISVELNREVHRVAAAIRQAALPGITDCVPGYATLYVEYDVALWSPEALAERIARLPAAPEQTSESRRIRLPVCYGGIYGMDLEAIAALHGLAEEEVVAMHTAGRFQVYFVGFTPGFAFMGRVDERIATDRRASPRVRVPAGSVGIAGQQTGIYPLDSPGGWNIVGRTPLPLYRPEAAEPILLQPGTSVRFVAVGEPEFLAIRQRPEEWRLVDA